MEQKMTGFILYLKSIVKSKTLYVTLASMILACVLLAGIKPSARSNITLGLMCDEGGEFSDDLMDELADSSFSCIAYDDEETLKDAVLRGDIDYGFRVRGDVREDVRNDDTDRTVIFYTTPFALYGEVVKESFAESYTAAISRYIIEDETDRVFDTEAGDPLERLLNKNEEYLDSELLFDVNILRTNTDSRDTAYTDDGAGSVGSGYIKIVIAMAVFISMMAVYGKTLCGDMKAVLGCMNRREKFVNSIMYMLAAALPVALVGLIMCGVLIGPGVIPSVGLRMILLIIYGILWTVLCGKLARKADTYSALIPVVTGLQILFCLGYIYMKDYVPIMSVVRFLFPAGLMM